MEAQQYAEKAENFLSPEIADFHDQKDLFKTFEDLYGENETFKKMPNSWIDNHVFSVDFLLHFFALHGYKLQKIRTKGVKFHDLSQTMSHYANARRERSAKAFQEMLANRTNTNT